MENLTKLDYWKFHRGIIDKPKEPKKPPKMYSVIYPNGVTLCVNKPYPYCKKVKEQHPLAEIKLY